MINLFIRKETLMGLYLGYTGPYKIGRKYKLYIGRKNQSHVHNFVFEQTVDATCTTEGYSLYRCSCNATSTREIIPALGHSRPDPNGNNYSNKGNGTHEYKCSRCSTTFTEAHTLGSYIWTANGHYQQCKYCIGQMSELADHTYNENGVCVCGAVDENGSYCEHEYDVTDTTWSSDHSYCIASISCSVCGSSDTLTSYAISTRDKDLNDYPQTGCTIYVDYEHVADFNGVIPEQTCPDWHEDSSRLTGEHDWEDATCTTPKTCKTCKTTEGEALGHTGGTATCTNKAECTVCKQPYGELAAHTPNEDDNDCTTAITCKACGAVTTPAKDSHTGGTATCKDKAKCEVCGKEYGELGAHTGGTATCTEKAVCTICEQPYGEALGHKEIEVAPAKEPTCTVAGHTAIIKCERCKVTLQGQQTIPATGHELVVTGSIPATCVDYGYVRSVCHKCNLYEYHAAKLDEPPTGVHTWTAWYEDDSNSDSGETIERRDCTVCGATETRGSSA
jgi:DNA-directed RNA polymerase subunit RPC12/RpoP